MRLASSVLLAFIFALVGLVLGILSRLERDRFYFFPNVGILLNSLAVIVVAFILYIGVFGI